MFVYYNQSITYMKLVLSKGNWYLRFRFIRMVNRVNVGILFVLCLRFTSHMHVLKSCWYGYFDRYVITPYNEYPPLLGLLLKLLNGELAWSTRREVLKVFRFNLTLVIAVMFFLMLILCWVPQVLGIMGALDPHVHKRNQLPFPGSHGEGTRATSDTGQHIRSMDELPMEPSFATSEDYYSTVKHK